MKHALSIRHHEPELETKAARREKRKTPRMNVSGANVKKLQQLLINKAPVDKKR